MKINKEQYETLVAKLDALQRTNVEATKDVEAAKAFRDKQIAKGNAWSERIEQGLDKLLQSHAALEKIWSEILEVYLRAEMRFNVAREEDKTRHELWLEHKREVEAQNKEVMDDHRAWREVIQRLDALAKPKKRRGK